MRLTNAGVRPTRTGFLVERALFRNLKAMFKVHLGEGSSGILLDLGCGNAPYARWLRGWHRVGLNIDVKDALPEVVGDGLALPFHDGCFDAVLCTQVVEHVRDPFRLIQEVARVLRPEGILILSGPMYWPLHEEPHDYWRFTKHGMRELIRRSGLEALETRTEGGAVALTAVSACHLFRGPVLAPVRLAVNLAGLVFDSLVPIHHSTCNLTLSARKP